MYIPTNYPNSSVDRDSLRSGTVILPIIGIIYFYGGIYILNKKYLYPSIEHLIGLLDEIYAPLAYCSLNTALYFFIMLYSNLLGGDSVGISTVIGSESINLLLLMGIVQFRLSGFSQIDLWIFLKDSVFYLGNIVLAVAFFSFEEFKWWNALVWLIYFGVYGLYFQKKNEALRDKLALMLGLKDEDDMFSCEENFTMKKRRHSLTDIMSQNLVDLQDPELSKKIARQEGALRIQLKDHEKFPIYSNFQRLVRIVIFAIQSKVEHEKKQRTEIFRERVDRMFNQETKKQKSIKETNAQNEDDENTNINENVKKDEEEILLATGGPKPKSQFAANNNDVSVNKNYEGQSQNDVLNNPDVMSNNKDEELNVDGEQKIGEIAVNSNLNLEDMFEGEEDDMTIPSTFGKKIPYFIFFPLNFLFFVILYYFRKRVDLKTAGFSIFTVLVLQAALCFFILWWTKIVTQSLDISNEIAGFTFTSVGFSLSFIVYNIKLQTHQKDANFLTTFEMIGIYKFGWACSISWLIYFVFKGQTQFNFVTRGLQVTTIIYLAAFVLIAGLIAANKARFHKKLSGPFLLFFIIFFIIGIVLQKEYDNLAF